MEYRSQEIKAGLMIVGSVFLFVLFLVATSGFDLMKKKKQYITRFSYTSGLEVGSLVRFGGMKVGVIKDMHIYDKDNSQIEFIIEVDETTPVKTNSEATVTSIGLMGEYHINISTGHPDSALLLSGNLLPCREVLSMSQLMEPLADIACQVNETLAGLKKFFDTENQNEFHNILANTNQLLAQNQQTIATMIENLNGVAENLNRMANKFDRLLAANETSISNSVKNLDETLAQTNILMKNIDKMMLDLDQAVLTKGDNFNQIIENLNRTSNNLEEFSRAIKERPWQLVRISAPKDRKFE